MAVVRSLAELAGDLRLGDGVTEPTGPAAVILARIDATSRVMVVAYAPLAPDEIHTEAHVREALLGGFGTADPERDRLLGGPAAHALPAAPLRSLAGPYKVRRAGADRRRDSRPCATMRSSRSQLASRRKRRL